MKIADINFPEFSGIRCLMMPFIQGDPQSLPSPIREVYGGTLKSLALQSGDVGFLTIDESLVSSGKPHRGDRAKYSRALHTEAGRIPGVCYRWGGGGWGASHRTTLDHGVEILLANNLDDSCAVWEAEEENTSLDGDIGHLQSKYPYGTATFLKAGEVFKIGILTPHESLPVRQSIRRQFLRIVSSGVHGREEYFTENPLLSV